MRYLIKGATIVNEGKQEVKDLLIEDGLIAKIGSNISVDGSVNEINADGLFLIPGIIDDQVHFREPGLTHKGELFTESRAAVAGGITSYMEMPNTVPNALTQELLQDKYNRAAEVSLANYSFFMGASNDNMDEVLKTDEKNVCGIKIFMGSSTGNMLVDNELTLDGIFSECPMLIATHCEDEATIRANTAQAIEQFGGEIPMEQHPLIRSVEACYKSSSKAIELAKKHNTRLHILHISTEKETHLFDNSVPLAQKRITAEACIHHLTFNDSMYETKGTLLKWNPAVKTEADRKGIFQALLDDRIDIIATDHAPHTWDEKQNTYLKAPSGGPLVQHALPAMMEHVKNGAITIERMVEKMCHAPAICFQMENRGFIREGYAADLVLVNPKNNWTVSKENILYKCGWSIFDGTTFSSSITHTFVNGNLAYANGKLNDSILGQRLTFNR
ncbi:MAG: dihydroorotase [Flavobacteriales bacterium]|jgi:dihydroorotase|nr:dihydroorotase [Flavobacteriales bacterium]